MPRSQPFTRLCQYAATLAHGPAADLHVHTHHSDGDCSPSQVVAFARQAKLAAVAITDHDTLAGVPAAEAAAAGFSLRVVPGVEISTEHAGRDYHLLGLFVRPNDPALSAALAGVRAKRRERFFRYLELVAKSGTSVPAFRIDAVLTVADSLGRRHLATLLVESGAVTSRSEAFRVHLGPLRDSVGVRHQLPLADAVRLVAAAGGVSSLAHPPAELTERELTDLAGLGLSAVEAHFPSAQPGRAGELRAWADRIGMAVTGGSDFHGPPDGPRRVGSHGLTAADYRRLAESTANPARPG